jgi:hypothetical protein
MASVAENLENVREQIAQAAAKAGRTAGDIQVSRDPKKHPARKCAGIAAGRTLFGEVACRKRARKSRTTVKHPMAFRQASAEKQDPPRYTIRTFLALIRLHWREISRVAADEGMHPRVLLE